MRNALQLLLPLALACIPLLAGCSGSGRPDGQQPRPGNGMRQGLRLLPGTELVSGQFSLRQVATPAGLQLELHGEGLSGLSRLYVSLPVPDPGYALNATGCDRLQECSPLSLAVLDGDELQFGWVATAGAFSGSGVIASFELRQETDGGPAVRATSKAVPAVDDLSRNAKWNILSWSYVNPGDYDQNGVVSISDLTPLGQNFGATGPFDPASAQWMVDGDGNGEINLADISVIGQNFGNSVSGYGLYAAPEGAGYPLPGSARKLADVSLDDAQGEPGERLHFRITDNEPLLGDRYWVIEEGAGEASALTPAWEKAWHAQKIHSVAVNGMLSGGRTRLAVIDGRPAVAMSGGGDETYIQYVIARDAVGAEWNEAVVVPTGQTINALGDMMNLGGRPGLVVNAFDKFTWFTATDPEGSSWNPGVLISDGYRIADEAFLADDRLVIASHALGLISLSSGDSTDPTVFSPLLPFSSFFNGSLTPDGDGFFIGYRDDANDNIYFSRFSIDFGAPTLLDSILLDDSGNVDTVHDSLSYNGLPYLWMTSGSAEQLQQVRAVTAEAQVWSKQPIDTEAGHYTNIDVVSVYGGLFMAYENFSQPGGFRIMSSDDGTVAAWTNQQQLLDDLTDVGRSRMAVVRGHPAIVYRTYADSTIDYYYARFY